MNTLFKNINYISKLNFGFEIQIFFQVEKNIEISNKKFFFEVCELNSWVWPQIYRILGSV